MSTLRLLPENETILRARFPVVYQRVQAAQPAQPQDFFYDSTQAGKYQLKTIRGEHSFETYGTGSRQELLKRWFDGLDLASESFYAISGFGDGSHLEYFLTHSSNGTIFLVAEKDPALLRETLSRIDCSKLLASDRLILGVGELDDGFFKDVQNAALSAIQDVNMLVFSPLHSVDEQYYDRMRNELIRQYLVVRPLIEVNLRTAPTIQRNTFANLPIMASAPDLAEIGSGFEDIPFILVGAGPSLDESIPFLQEVQDRAIIVTSNSPLRKLINNDIQPHLVVTADPGSPTFEGFDGVNLEGLRLACPFSAYPAIVDLFPGRIFSWCTFNPIVDLLKKAQGKPPGSKIMEKGTVSGCVLDISRLLGCKKVLFVGQDMSIRSDGRYYTDDSAYADRGAHYATTTQGHKLPGNTEDEVLVEGRLFVYLKTFEEFIRKQNKVEYRNLARTGVRVQGAPYISFEDAKSWIGESVNGDFVRKLDSLLQQQSESGSLGDVLNPCRKYAARILDRSLSAAIKVELLPDKFASLNYAENKAIRGIIEAGKEINALVDSNKDYWGVLFEGKTKAEIVKYRRVIRDIDHPNQNWAVVQRNKEYFWALAEGCHWLLSEIDKHDALSCDSKKLLPKG
jgi:hypothetical protein